MYNYKEYNFDENKYKLIENFSDNISIPPSECLPNYSKLFVTAKNKYYCRNPANDKYSLPTECSEGYIKDSNMCKPITPVQAQPVQVQAQPVQVQAQPVQVQVQPVQTQPVQVQVQPVQTQPVQVQAQPVQAQPVQAQPVQVQAQPVQVQAQPVQAQPVQVQAQPVQVQAQPVQVQAQPVSSVQLIEPSECLPNQQKVFLENKNRYYCLFNKQYTLPTECSEEYVKESNMCKMIKPLNNYLTNMYLPTECSIGLQKNGSSCYNINTNKNSLPTECSEEYVKIGNYCKKINSIIKLETNNIITKQNTLLTTPNILSNIKTSDYYGIYNMPKSYIEPLYDYPLYYWEGLSEIDNNLDIINRLSITNDVIIDTSKYINQFNKRYLIIINNTLLSNDLPNNNYLIIKIPIDPNTHNTIFLQTITRAKWNNINMCICDPNTKKPIKKVITRCNTNNNVKNIGNSSFLGPYNNNSIQGFYEWLSFGVSKDLINNYKTSTNEIYISLNCGVNSFPSIILSGVAVCSNPYGVTTIPAINLFWGNNGVYKNINNKWITNGIKYNNISDDEASVEILTNEIFKINVPILSTNKGLIIGFILNNNSWYDGNIQIYLFNNKYYELSPLIIGRYGVSNLSRGVYRYPKGFFIHDVSSFIKYDNNGMMYIEIIIDNSKDIYSTNIRGIYTELVEPE